MHGEERVECRRCHCDSEREKRGCWLPSLPLPSHSLIHCYVPTVDDTTVKEKRGNARDIRREAQSVGSETSPEQLVEQVRNTATDRRIR